MIKQLALAACLASAPSTAHAQEKQEQPVIKRKTVLDFSELEITGQIVRPEATLIQGRIRTKFRPLILYRGDFRPELLKSIEQL